MWTCPDHRTVQVAQHLLERSHTHSHAITLSSHCVQLEITRVETRTFGDIDDELAQIGQSLCACACARDVRKNRFYVRLRAYVCAKFPTLKPTPHSQRTVRARPSCKPCSAASIPTSGRSHGYVLCMCLHENLQRVERACGVLAARAR